jgi:hypothetical protein
MADEIPGVRDEDLVAVVRDVSALPSSEERDADRFAREVRGVVESRAQLGWPDEGNSDVAAFVLVDYPREVGRRLGGRRVLDLIASQVPLLGRVFFLTRDASNGAFIEFPTAPAEILDWLSDSDLGTCAVILVYRTRKLMVSRRAGVAGEVQQDPIRDVRPSASLPELLDALEFFHRRKLLIPSLCPDGVWESGRAVQYVPGVRPEKCIQKELKGALNFWFRGVVRADTEDSTDIGRIDVRLLKVEEERPLYYWAIVELKVIRSKHNARVGEPASPVTITENADAIVEGVLQANAYRANRQAEEGLLEVYDLRRDKSYDMFRQQKVVKALAECDPVPSHNMRPLFGNPSHARAAGHV